MNPLLPEEWKALDRIEHGQCAVDTATAERLCRCGLIEAKATDRFALTGKGWQALRQHRRLDPD